MLLFSKQFFLQKVSYPFTPAYITKNIDDAFINRENPRIGLFFSAPRMLKLLILFYTGLLPFVPLRETHFEIPMLSIFLKNNFARGNIIFTQFELDGCICLCNNSIDQTEQSTNFVEISVGLVRQIDYLAGSRGLG